MKTILGTLIIAFGLGVRLAAFNGGPVPASGDYAFLCPGGSPYWLWNASGSFLVCGHVTQRFVPCADNMDSQCSAQGPAADCLKLDSCPYGCPDGLSLGGTSGDDRPKIPGLANPLPPASGAGGCGGDSSGNSTLVPARCKECEGGNGQSGGGNGGPNGGSDYITATTLGGNGLRGMPIWQVVEPILNVFVKDKPFSYQPTRGKEIAFQLIYKNYQDETGDKDNNMGPFFSVGKRWHTPWRSYFVTNSPATGEPSGFYLVAGDGSTRLYKPNQRDYDTGSTLAYDASDKILTLNHTDGSFETYSMNLTNSAGQSVAYFLTSRSDAQLRVLQTYAYEYPSNSIRLQSITDLDGRQITFTYTNVAPYSNLVSQVDGPFGLQAKMAYNANAELVWIRDTINLESTMSYDSSNRVSQLITPYGTNDFKYYFPTNGEWLGLRITEMGVRTHLWIYGNLAIDPWTGADEQYSSLYNRITSNALNYQTEDGFTLAPSFSQPTIGGVSGQLKNRNAGYWGPRQYGNLSSTIRTSLDDGSFGISSLTTNEYNLGHLKHFLRRSGFATGYTVSLQRPPGAKADGSEAGAITWYDYAGKNLSFMEGTNNLPRYVATRVRQDVSTPANDEWYIQCHERDGLGNVTVFRETYGPLGSVGVRKKTYEYDTNSPIDLVATYIRRSGADYQEEAFQYGNGDHLVTQYQRDPTGLNYTTTYEYTGDQQISRITDPAGLITEYTYDGTTKLRLRVDQKNGTQTFSTVGYKYVSGLLDTATNALGWTTSYVYDKLWRPTEIHFPDSTGITNVYNRLDIGKVTDRLGLSVGFEKDNFRQTTRTTNQLGKVIQYQYCTCGSLDSVTDPMGKTTTFTYDNQGKRLRTTYPGGSWFEDRYNLVRQLTNTVDIIGVAVTNTFNIQGLFIRRDRAFGKSAEFTYDIQDRVLTATDQNGVTVTMTYDELGRMITRTLPSTGVTKMTYSTRGLIGVTNELGFKTTYTLDERSLKLGETNSLNNKVTYTYNAAGALLGLTNELGNATSWVYDTQGRNLQKVDATSAVIVTNNWDANRRLIQRWSKEKGLTAYAYSAAGSLTNVDYPSGTSDIGLAYDDNQRLTQMVDGIGTTAFSYTDDGKLLSENGPWANDTVTYAYTSNLQPQSLTLQQANATDWVESYAYDAGGRWTNVTSQAGSFGYSYYRGLVGGSDSPAILVQKLYLGNGSVITNDFDTTARLVRTHLKKSDGTMLNSHEYQYDLGNRRTRQTRTAGDYADYTYDAIGELESATGKDAVGANVTNRLNELFGYAYDAAGNLSRRTNGNPSGSSLVQTLNVDSRNQLTTGSRSGTLTVSGTTSGAATNVTVKDNANAAVAGSLYLDGTFARAGITIANGNNTFIATAKDSSGRTDVNTTTVNLPTSETFTYDQNGNMTGDGKRSFEYDAENQLTNVFEATQWKTEFRYDGRMRLRIRREFTWSSGAWLQTNECRYVYDGNLVVQERNSQNIAMVSYTRGKDLSGSRSGAGGIGGLLARTDHASQSHAYYQADGNGNVTYLSNGSQVGVARYVYDPFGNLISSAGGLAEANRYRFSSKEAHPNSGLVYYLYRFYDANLQRWLNRDPRGEQGFETLHRRHVPIKVDPAKQQLTAENSDHRTGRLLVNGYNFNRNSPANGIDPNGEMSMWIVVPVAIILIIGLLLPHKQHPIPMNHPPPGHYRPPPRPCPAATGRPFPAPGAPGEWDVWEDPEEPDPTPWPWGIGPIPPDEDGEEPIEEGPIEI